MALLLFGRGRHYQTETDCLGRRERRGDARTGRRGLTRHSNAARFVALSAAVQDHTPPPVQKVRDRQSKRLPAERPRLRDVHRLRRGVGIDGLGVRRRGPQLLATLALRLRRHVAIKPRHPGHDDLLAVGLEDAIAHAPTDR